MTTPNSSTNGLVKSFVWKKFPVEEDKFSICLVSSGSKITKEFENLCEYIKIVFPEKLIIHDTPEFYTTQLGKHTVFKEFNDEKECPLWLESYSLFEKYLHTKSHIIVTGEYNKIPSTVFTNSRIIIFESQDDLNKYLQSKHGATLNNFNVSSNFIVVDKSIMGHFNIYGLFKGDLIRYDKDFRASL